MNELIRVLDEKDLNPVALFEEDKAKEIVASICEQESDVVYDISTEKGRKEVKSKGLQIGKCSKILDEVGKDYVATFKERTKAIDKSRKSMRDQLEALRDKIEKPYIEYEEAETSRKNDILARANAMVVPVDFLPEDLEGFYETVKAVVVDDSFAEFQEFATQTKEDSLLKLEALIARKKAEEKAIADAEAERIKQDEQARLDREAQLVKAAEERVQREAEEKAKQAAIESSAREQAAKDAQAKAERDKIAAEERAKIEKENTVKAEQERVKKAEAERIEADKRAKIEQENAVKAEQARAAKEEADRVAVEEKRAANKKHRSKINNVILTEFKKYMTEEKGKELITRIAKGDINNLVINY